tara:strand:- start:10963 stop:11205 length:243 start_codon:yes stop_codon:yes gene_type:complete
MGLNRILHTKFGQTLLSIILGFGLASLFRKVCRKRSCMIFKAPTPKDIEEKVYKFEDKCYKFKPNPAKCDVSKKIIDFEK